MPPTTLNSEEPVMLRNGCSSAKVACNSYDNISEFEAETLKSCGFWGVVNLCRRRIACEGVGRICGRLGITTVRCCRLVAP